MITAVEKLIQQEIPRRDPPEGVKLAERAESSSRRRGERGSKTDSAPKSEGGSRTRRSRSESGKSERAKTEAPRDEARAKPASPAASQPETRGSARGSDQHERSDRYERSDRQERYGERGRGRGRDDRNNRYQERDEQVLGFGDNPPAFFLVAARGPETKKAEEDA